MRETLKGQRSSTCDAPGIPYEVDKFNVHKSVRNETGRTSSKLERQDYITNGRKIPWSNVEVVKENARVTHDPKILGKNHGAQLQASRKKTHAYTHTEIEQEQDSRAEAALACHRRKKRKLSGDKERKRWGSFVSRYLGTTANWEVFLGHACRNGAD